MGECKMNGKKAKQARRLTVTILSTAKRDDLALQRVNIRQHRIPLLPTQEVFVYETATVVNPRRRTYQKVKNIIRDMPRLV